MIHDDNAEDEDEDDDTKDNDSDDDAKEDDDTAAVKDHDDATMDMMIPQPRGCHRQRISRMVMKLLRIIWQ